MRVKPRFAARLKRSRGPSRRLQAIHARHAATGEGGGVPGPRGHKPREAGGLPTAIRPAARIAAVSGSSGVRPSGAGAGAG
jgi:hypothetical protein